MNCPPAIFSSSKFNEWKKWRFIAYLIIGIFKMNNAVFKIECLKVGLYNAEQVIDFYKMHYGEDTKYNKRDAQLWLNGKANRAYLIDQKAIDLISSLKEKKENLVNQEKERLSEGLSKKYTLLYKHEMNLWNDHPELFNLPLNFYNSILVEMGTTPFGYFEELIINK